MTLEQAIREIGNLLVPRADVFVNAPVVDAGEKEFPYQTDPAFSENHNRYGCYFQSIGKIAWQEGTFRSAFPRKEFNAYAKICTDAEYIKRDFRIRLPNNVFLVMGLVVEYTDRWENADRDCAPDEREILRMVYKGVEHFVVGDGRGQVEWDPWSATGSYTAKHGTVKDKRIFKIIGRLGEA